MDFKGNAPKLMSVAITLGVIALLIFSGVTSAFDIGLTGFSVSNVVKGGSTSTTATINVRADDIVNVGDITLSLTGPESRTCVFNEDGSVVSGCDGITISSPVKTTSTTTGYGYGYGYGYGGYSNHSGITDGSLTYTITLDTTNFTVGVYSAELSTVLGSHTYKSSSQSLTVSDAAVTSYHGGRIGGTIVPVHSATANSGESYTPFPPAGETPAAAPTGTEGAPAGITGAVIGALTSTAGIVTIIVVIAGLGVSFAALRMRKAGKKRGKAEKEED